MASKAWKSTALAVTACLLFGTIASTSDTPACDLVITPEQPTLEADGNKVVLRASGGDGTYTWTVGNLVLGHLSDSSGHAIVYTRNNPGDNYVGVSSGGCEFFVVIKQP